MGNHLPEVEVPGTVGETEKNGTFGRVRPQNLVKDGLQEQNPKCLKHADDGQQQHSGQPLEPVGQPITQQAQEILHAG